MPADDADDGRDVVDVVVQEGRGRGIPEHDRRLEPPQGIVVDRAPPPVGERDGKPPRRDRALEERAGLGADGIRRAQGQAARARHGGRQGVDRGDRGADGCRGPAAGRDVGGLDAVAVEPGRDEDVPVGDRRVAERGRHAEGEERAGAVAEGAQREGFGDEHRARGVARRRADDRARAVREVHDRGVEAALAAAREGRDARHLGAGDRRRHRRG